MDRKEAKKSDAALADSIGENASKSFFIQGITRNMLLHDRYLLDKKIGSGGMGEIYKAFDTQGNNRPVAVKRLFCSDEISKKRFLREYNLLKSVNHPSLIKVFEYFEMNDESFMVLEYAQGETMKSFLDQDKNIFTLAEQLVIATKVARAVHKLNSLGIIHRDIKPDNIMINKEAGDVKLLDLGIGKEISDSGRLTQTGIGVGSAGYMSPEQLEGQAGEKSDIFCLGITLYQFFSWQRTSPFAAPSYFITAMKIVEYNPPPLLEVVNQSMAAQGKQLTAKDAKIYSGLSDCIAKAMAKKIKERLNDCNTIAEKCTELYQEYMRGDISPTRGALATLTINVAEILESEKKQRKEGEKFDIKELKEADFVGREELFSQMEEPLLSVKKGMPQFVLVNGEDGIGKSRMVKEFIKKYSIEKEEIFCFSENCQSQDEHRPFLPFIRLLWKLYQKRGKLPAKEYVPGYYSLLPPDFIEFSFSSLNEKNLIDIFLQVETSPENTFACIASYLRTHSRYCYLCLILEDIDVMDRRSTDCLFYLFNTIKQGDRILILATYKGDKISGENNVQRILPHFRSGKNFQEIKLTSLLKRDISPFLRSMLGSLQMDPTEIASVYQITQGKPYLLIDFIKGLCHEGKITWANDSWSLELGDDILTRPPKALEEQLIKNFSGLGKYHKIILQWLSLSGFPLSYESLIALTGLKESQIPYVVGDLLKSRYIFEQEIQKEKVYAISSSKIALGILDGIQGQEQKKFHLHLARLLEKKNDKEMQVKASDHYYLAEDSPKALAMSLKVAKIFMQEKEISRSLRYYQRALSIARESKDKSLCAILVEFASHLYRLGDYKNALVYFDEATVPAMKMGKDEEVKKGKALCLYGMRKYEQALQEARNFISLYRSQEDPEIFLTMAEIEIYRYNMKKAQEYCAKAKSACKQSPPPLLAPILKKVEGWLSFYQGEWKRSLECFNEAEKLSEELSSNQNAMEILLGKSCLLFNEKGPVVALESIQEVLTFAYDTDDTYLQFLANYHAGNFALEQGEIATAERYFQQLKSIHAEKGMSRHLGYASLGLAQCSFLRKEETDVTEKLGQEALQVAHDCGDQFLSAETYHLMAKVYRRFKQIQKAITYVDYSKNMFNSLDMKWKANRLASTYARLLTLGKKPKEALQALVEAGKIATEIGDRNHISDNYFERGFTLARNKKFEDAIKWFSKAEDLYKELGRESSMAEASDNKKKCGEATGKNSQDE